MVKPWWSWLLAVTAVLVLTVVGYDRMLTIIWDGYTNLEVEFLVTDAATGEPVNGARINVHSEFPPRDAEQDFSLVTDEGGIARHACTRMSSGKESGLGFTKTFSVSLPEWAFRVSAPGYETSELLSLPFSKYGRQVQRLGGGQTKLVVRVPIRKVNN
jgi:hypothetical protein